MNVETRPLHALRPHPLNAEIYGDAADDELVARVQMMGVLTPLLISHDGTVISGHRRLDAATRLGLAEVPVIVSPLRDFLDLEEVLIESNRQRQPSNEQRVREYRHLKALRLARAGARGPRPVPAPVPPPAEAALGTPPPPTPPQRPLGGGLPALPRVDAAPPDEEGVDRRIAREARAEAARQVGGSATALEKGARVVEYIDALAHAERRDEAEDLRQLLNRRSVGAAWRKLTAPEPPPAAAAPPPPVAKMRKLAEELEMWLAEQAEDGRADKVAHAIEALRAVVELYADDLP
jgi:hypothetical protein